MSTARESAPITVDSIELHVQASVDGVIFGKTVAGIDASDLLLTPEQARQLAADLMAGAFETESARA